jgi:hypothetical protein
MNFKTGQYLGYGLKMMGAVRTWFPPLSRDLPGLTDSQII